MTSSATAGAEERSEESCASCGRGPPPMADGTEVERLRTVPSWDLRRNGVHKLIRAFRFRDLRTAMDFVSRIAELAEAEGHHPNIGISWNKVRLELFTHDLGGLSEKDFAMAAKIDAIFAPEAGMSPAPATVPEAGPS